MRSPLEQLLDAKPPAKVGTLEDVLNSIRSALECSDITSPELILGVPDDNDQVMEILAKVGGELRITIRSVPRPVLELLADTGGHPVPLACGEDPNLPGMSFGGGM